MAPGWGSTGHLSIFSENGIAHDYIHSINGKYNHGSISPQYGKHLPSFEWQKPSEITGAVMGGLHPLDWWLKHPTRQSDRLVIVRKAQTGNPGHKFETPTRSNQSMPLETSHQWSPKIGSTNCCACWNWTATTLGASESLATIDISRHHVSWVFPREMIETYGISKRKSVPPVISHFDRISPYKNHPFLGPSVETSTWNLRRN